MITNIAAWIGFFTGVISFIFLCYKSILEISKVEIKQSCVYKSFVFDRHKMGIENFNFKYGAVLTTTISNKSSLPVTIENAFIKSKLFDGHQRNHNCYLDLQPYKVPVDNGSAGRIKIPKKIILPCRLEAFDSITVSFYFARLEPLIDQKVLIKPIKLKVGISTSRKTFYSTFTVSEYELIVKEEHMKWFSKDNK